MLNPKHHAVIKGEDALMRYCERRWKQHPRFIEHFAHLPECDFEKIEAKSPTDTHYCAYFFLALRREDGYSTRIDSQEIYEAIRNGTIKLLNV